ncbi:hypothetical protein U5A82_04510 [Sphingobium sp. CR2-8]|uniref:hypothetical protein n=1 Tax=Sphingobium sp. CR2-8 TaxID=1306534 RepID=UPI002DBE2632|nr:hypothetical protein [Sphingobium sp. CR2-8]MEC3909755.1 hypothetical protein [Sphingobium sp. CR2-8]
MRFIRLLPAAMMIPVITAPVLAQPDDIERTVAASPSPNGGRPEIHNVDEMRKMGGYTAPGARAYADMAAEAGASSGL